MDQKEHVGPWLRLGEVPRRGNHQGAPGGPGAPWWVVPSSGLPPGATRAQLVPSGPSNISIKFRGIWNPSDIDFL